jgi:hypothetical protein
MTAVKADGIAARQVQTLRQCQGPRPRREASPHRREEKLMQNERSRMTGPKIKEGASTILISTDERFPFQLRDNVPGISDPGKLGFFGGGREGDESFLDCVVGEVHEEIGYFISPER